MAKKTSFKRLLGYLKPYWFQVVLNFIFNLISIVFSLFSFSMFVPFLNLLFGTEELVTVKPAFSFSVDGMLNYLDYYISQIIINHGTSSALLFICILLVTAFFFRNAGRFMANFYLASIRTNIVRDLRNNLYHKLLILPLSFYSKSHKGDIMARLTTDVQEVEVSILNYLDTLIRDPLTVIAYFLFLLSLSPELTLFVVILLPLAGVIIGYVGKTLKRESVKGQTKLAELLTTIEETISGLRIIKAFNAIGYSKSKFGDQNQHYSKILTHVYRKRDLSSPMSEFLSAIVVIAVLWFGGRLILSGSATIQAADFVTYIIVFSQIISPVKNFSQGYYHVQKGIAGAERIFNILDADEVIEEAPDAKHINALNDSIEYSNVSFGYDSENVLTDINLTIKKGQLIAIVGESGGGKSTLTDLLPRFYDVREGNILIDGTDIRQLNIADLRGLMGIVTQESILFNDTVHNNIAFGLDNVSRADVEKAARIANAHEFIMQMEKGYDTPIGDRGMNLSGGQRQRLSIARAILRNPQILILDEATSSLDTESEQLVQSALNNVMSNRTSIVIAHRLSTIIHADEIIVISKGRIVERGTHNELIARNGIYTKLSQMQSL